MYRILDSISSGILTSKAQYNKALGKTNTTKYYRSEILKNIINEIMQGKEEGVKECIVAGDFNQDIAYENI